MRTAAAVRSQVPPYSFFLITTDEMVGPEAETYLSSDYDVHIFRTWDEVVAAHKKQTPQAILLDIDTIAGRSEDGVAALAELRSIDPDVVLAALTRSNSRRTRQKAIAATVDEYFVAPIDFKEVCIVLNRALEKRAAELEFRKEQEKEAQRQSFYGLIGASEVMRLVYAAVTRVAESSSTVLIRGESGTGKELVARAIVAAGTRSAKPFISINCAALPENLIETELFGHEKGAFTDAQTARPGHIELAHTGTLFMDEIATLGLALQSKLLRVLEDRVVTRIGGKTPKKIDFRLITATNENLEDMVHTGRFREDLYYRIHVIPISLPPLRERAGDIPLLLNHFLRLYSDLNHVLAKQIDPQVIEILEEYSWPGNIRELENLVQRLVLLVDGPVIMAKHLPQQIVVTTTTSQEALLIPEGGVNFDEEMARIEAAYVGAALRRSGGSKIGAARLLHMDKQKIHYLCRKHGIGRD
jgi:two-component system response regulator PilR (NtrC family)